MLIKLSQVQDIVRPGTPGGGGEVAKRWGLEFGHEADLSAVVGWVCKHWSRDLATTLAWRLVPLPTAEVAMLATLKRLLTTLRGEYPEKLVRRCIGLYDLKLAGKPPTNEEWESLRFEAEMDNRLGLRGPAVQATWCVEHAAAALLHSESVRNTWFSSAAGKALTATIRWHPSAEWDLAMGREIAAQLADLGVTLPPAGVA